MREPFIYHNGAVLQLDKCTTKFIYECYVQMKYVTPTYVLKWKTLHVDFDMSKEEWADVFLRPYICLRETKLKSFQYKIINRIINCNKKLLDMKIKNSPVCSYCDQTDDIGHFFFMCKDVYDFLKRIYTWWNTFDHDDVDFPAFPNVKTVIFGSQSQCITETVAVLNFCMFHIKYYIHRQRLFQDNVFHLHEIQKRYSQNWKSKKTSVKKKRKTTNLINWKYFMKTWNDKASILKINLPTMEGIAFVFTNTWTREQNIGFHGRINHVTKTCGTT